LAVLLFSRFELSSEKQSRAVAGLWEKSSGELISGCWSAFLDNLQKLSVWLGIHGGLSVRQAGHPRFAPRAAAPTAGAHIASLLQARRTLLRRTAARRPAKELKIQYPVAG
jgi:hypothetical protein